MKKNLLIVMVLLFSFTMTGLAAPVSKEQAVAIARNLLQQYPLRNGADVVTQKITIDQVYHAGDAKRGTMTEDNNAPAYFYVAHRGANDGYVLIAADDKLPAVLAYSPVGRFSMEKMPDNLRTWLQIYEEEIALILSGKAEASSDALRTDGVPAVILPLMDNGAFASDPIRWNQAYPWNEKEPMLPNGQRGYTGCVATAIAQIMRYHRWPNTAEGSFDYYAGSLVGQWSGTFGDTYEWDNMPGNPNLQNVPAEQVNAYATFMRDVSASVNMSFYENGSGTYSVYVVDALRDHFRYKKSVKQHVRFLYTAQQWQDMVRREIAANRPVYYAGNNQSVGHAFVCDGYAADGTFHFNWGWGGVSNGYYRLSLLSPTSLGIGGQGIGFTIYQEILTGVEPAYTPDQAGTDALTDLTFDKLNAEYDNYGLEVEYTAYNLGETSSRLDIGYRLQKPDGSVSEVNKTTHTLRWFGFGDYENIYFSISKDQFAIGPHTITLLYRREGSTEWKELCHMQGGFESSILVNTSNPNNVEVTTFEHSGELTLVPNSVVANLNAFEHSTITAKFQNTTADEIRTPVAFGISGTNDQIISIGWSMAEAPAHSNDYTLNFSTGIVPAEVGTYVLWYKYSAKESDYNWQKIGNVTVQQPTVYTHPLLQVNHEQTETTLLLLGQSYELPPFTVKNVGLPFDGRFGVRLQATDGSSTYNLGFKNMYLGQGDSFVYTPVLEHYVNVPDGLYSVRILPVVGNSIQNYITGNLSYRVKIVNTTAVETVETARVSVYPNPAQDYATITAPTAGDASVVLFDQAGRIVAKTTLTAGTGRIELSQLPSGTYIIRIDDYTGKLIIAH